jgi:drug/metabolite transporter superfamily protein YnfA
MRLLPEETGMTTHGIKARRASGSLRRQVMWAVIALLLVLPLVAMPFTPEIKWSGSDFAAAGALLVGTGLVYELVVNRLADRTLRTVATVALLGVLLLAWAHGAVGVF